MNYFNSHDLIFINISGKRTVCRQPVHSYKYNIDVLKGRFYQHMDYCGHSVLHVYIHSPLRSVIKMSHA